jgi:hypothetical protein
MPASIAGNYCIKFLPVLSSYCIESVQLTQIEVVLRKLFGFGIWKLLRSKSAMDN